MENTKILTTGIIYKRTSPSGKVYIGQTIYEELRNRRWFLLSRPYTKQNSKIDRARRKYPPQNWKYEVLFKIEGERKEVDIILDEKEVYYIQLYDSYNNGYNSSKGGEHIYDSSKPIVIYDLYSKELLYKFHSINEAIRHFNKHLLQRIKRKSNSKDYYPPIGKLPDERHVLIYFEDDFTNEVFEFDRDQALKISKYRKIIQISENGDIVKIWNCPDNVNKFYNKEKWWTISIICKKSSNDNYVRFDNCIWMFYDEYLEKIKKEDIKTILNKEVKEPSYRKPLIVFDFNGNFIDIFSGGTQALKFFLKRDNNTFGINNITKSRKSIVNYKNQEVYSGYKHIWAPLDFINELKEDYFEVNLYVSGENFNPYIRVDEFGNIIERFTSVAELRSHYPNIEPRFTKLLNNTYIDKTNNCVWIRDTNNKLTLDIKSAKEAIIEFMKNT